MGAGVGGGKKRRRKKRKRKPELGYRRGTSTGKKTDGESSEGDEKMKNKE